MKKRMKRPRLTIHLLLPLVFTDEEKQMYSETIQTDPGRLSQVLFFLSNTKISEFCDMTKS